MLFNAMILLTESLLDTVLYKKSFEKYILLTCGCDDRGILKGVKRRRR